MDEKGGDHFLPLILEVHIWPGSNSFDKITDSCIGKEVPKLPKRRRDWTAEDDHLDSLEVDEVLRISPIVHHNEVVAIRKMFNYVFFLLLSCLIFSPFGEYPGCKLIRPTTDSVHEKGRFSYFRTTDALKWDRLVITSKAVTRILFVRTSDVRLPNLRQSLKTVPLHHCDKQVLGFMTEPLPKL